MTYYLSIPGSNKKTTTSEEKSNSEIPIVRFGNDGNPITKTISKAVPVYIIGQGLPGKTVTRNPDGSIAGSTGVKSTSLLNSMLVKKQKVQVDTSITEKKDIPKEQLEIFNAMIDLPESPTNTNGKALGKGRITSLLDLKCEIENQLGKKMTEDIKLTTGTNSLEDQRYHLIYVYAAMKGYKGITDYLTNTRGIFYKLRRRQKVLKTIGKVTLGILTAGLVPLGVGIFKGIRGIIRNIKLNKIPKSKNDLDGKARNIYDSLEKQNFGDIRLLLQNTSYVNNTTIVTIKGIKVKKLSLNVLFDNTPNDADKTNLAKAVYAQWISEIQLRNLYLLEAKILDENGKVKTVGSGYTEPNNFWKHFKAATKKGFFGTIGAAFKRIGRGTSRLFGKRNNDIAGKSMTDAEELAAQNAAKDNSGQNLFLPKIKIINNETTEDNILEAVPVWVVNQIKMIDVNNKKESSYKKLGWGSDGNNAGGGKITNAELTLIDYGRKYGMDMIDQKNGYIKITNFDDTGNPITANKADASTGRNIKNNQPKKGWYKPTKETIAWALENGEQFYRGGSTFSDTFITGDAPGKNIWAGGKNPELVQVHSKSPVFSTITPIKKFANGGTSQSEAMQKVNIQKPTAMDNLKATQDRYTSLSNQLSEEKSTLDSIRSLGAKVSNRTMKKLDKSIEKVQKIMDDIQMRSNMAQAIQQLGGEVPEGIMTMKEKQLAKYLSKAVKQYMKQKKEDKKGKGKKTSTSVSTLISSDAEKTGVKSIDSAKPALPVFIVNEYANGRELFNHISNVNDSITSNFATLMTGLGSGFQLVAPWGVGAGMFAGLIGTGIAQNVTSMAAAVMDTAADVGLSALGANTGGIVTKAATGGTTKQDKSKKSSGLVKGPVPRFATGGTHNVITGDAAGNNIFAKGAKPELVQSEGDLKITPLNKSGEERKSKIDRMSPNERRSALATAISSHVVRFNYTLSSDVTEVSNEGEAIKVFDVKPGFTDKVSVGDTEVSPIEILAGIQAELAVVASSVGISNQMLTLIASKPTGAQNNKPASTDTGLGGFPTSMDNILGGY